MCVESFLEEMQHTIQALAAIATLISSIVALYLARRQPFQLRGEISFDEGSRSFSLKCVVKRGSEFLSASDARTFGHLENIEFQRGYGFLIEKIFKSKKISTILGGKNDNPITGGESSHNFPSNNNPTLLGMGYPLLELVAVPLGIIDCPEKYLQKKSHVTLVKTLPCKKKAWGIVIVLGNFFSWKLYLQHAQLGVIKIKPTTEAKKVIIGLLLMRLAESERQ